MVGMTTGSEEVEKRRERIRGVPLDGAEPSTLVVNLPRRRKSLISKLGQMKLGNPGTPFI